MFLFFLLLLLQQQLLLLLLLQLLLLLLLLLFTAIIIIDVVGYAVGFVITIVVVGIIMIASRTLFDNILYIQHGMQTKTNCTRCPAALSKLSDLAGKDENADAAVFVSIALMQGGGGGGGGGQDNFDVAAELSEDDSWANVRPYFAETAEKETIKQMFGITKVPYLIVLDAVILLDLIYYASYKYSTMREIYQHKLFSSVIDVFSLLIITPYLFILGRSHHNPRGAAVSRYTEHDRELSEVCRYYYYCYC